jgi:hypothetical protein
MPELPDAKKWAFGFVDITRWIKDVGTLIRIVIIIAICYLLYVGGVAIWKRVVPIKEPQNSVETINCPGGKCEVTTGDKRTNWGFINIK